MTKEQTEGQGEKLYLDLLGGTDLVNLRKITEVTMDIGEHPLAFASKLWEMFNCNSGLPNATKQKLTFKSVLIAQSS